VLRETLAGDRDASGEPERVDVLSGLAQRRQGELRDAAWSLGRRLFADKPRRFCRRMHRYWQAAQYDTQSTPQD
ncbi:MAG: hypothetical protein PVJ83_03935, partial [Gammaproteobacteria bacterium]